MDMEDECTRVELQISGSKAKTEQYKEESPAYDEISGYALQAPIRQLAS